MTRRNWNSLWHRHGMVPRGVSNAYRLQPPPPPRPDLTRITYDALGHVLVDLSPASFQAFLDALPARPFMSDAGRLALDHSIADVTARRLGARRPPPREGPPTALGASVLRRVVAAMPRTAVSELGQIANTHAAEADAYRAIAVTCDGAAAARD